MTLTITITTLYQGINLCSEGCNIYYNLIGSSLSSCGLSDCRIGVLMLKQVDMDTGTGEVEY